MRKRKFSINVGVLLSDEIYEKLVQITNQEEVPLSEYVRKLIENKINKKGEANNE
jgi:predicted CopG family antitoxin